MIRVADPGLATEIMVLAEGAVGGTKEDKTPLVSLGIAWVWYLLG